MILLSHGHFDHIAGAAALKEATDAPVFIHQAEEQWPTNPNLNGSTNLGELCPVPVTGPRPDELLEDGQRLNWAEPELTCLHTPGHTPGGVSFYAAEEAAVFTGDALFAGSIGRTDLPGGDHEQLLAALRDKLLSLADDTVVYPGHGPTTTIGEQAAHNPFLTKRQP
jgi:glyoxylase-like metal-dependent hydrolase (beta-lactamase superfamily II)